MLFSFNIVIRYWSSVESVLLP